MDGNGPREAFVSFARTHITVVSRVAGLVHDDPDEAAQATAGALAWAADRSNRWSDDSARLAAVLGRLVRRTQRTALLAAARPGRGELEVRDVVGRGAAEDAAVSLGAAWMSLSRSERSAVSLSLVGGLDPSQVAHATWRRPTAVRRDLQRGTAFLAEALGAGPTAATIEAIRTSLAPASQPTPHQLAVVERLRQGPQTGRPGLPRKPVLAAAAAAVAALVVGVAIDVRLGSPPSAPALPGAPDAAAGPTLPTTLSGLKLVGYRGTMLAVPMAWEQARVPCDDTTDDYVAYPGLAREAPCDASGAQTSGLSFGAADKVNLPSLNRSRGDIVPIDRVVVTSIHRRGGVFVQAAAVLDANVAVFVHSPDRAEVRAVIASVQRVPAGFAVMPAVEGLSPRAALKALARVGLIGMIYQDPSQVGYHPLVVLNQAPDVGTLVSLDDAANLGVVLR